MEHIDIEELIGWVRQAGAIAIGSFKRVVGHRKADHTWVTEADLAIERMLVERITSRFPDHGIIGEEQTRHMVDREFLWAIDPLDGTAVFISGLPTWGISLGLLRNRKPYLGVIYMPLPDDCYWSVPGGGAWLNGQPIHVAPPHQFDSDDWIATPSNVHRRFAIDFVGKTRSIGATVGSFAYTARGSAVGGLVSRFAIWDVAAGIAILEAAGGTAVGLSGQPFDIAAILDGQTWKQPVVLGAPEHAEQLRTLIVERGQSSA